MSDLNLDALLGAGVTVGLSDHRPCLIGRMLTALPGEYAAALTALIDDTDVSLDRIEHTLRQAGLPGRHTLISKHRRGTCGCGNLTSTGGTK